MSNHKKKIFPKFKKKIKAFLTDESWKITKKDALWLAAWSVLLNWIWEVDALSWGHSNTVCWHANQGAISAYWTAWHLNWTKSTHGNTWFNWHYSNSPTWGHYNWLPIWWHISQGHANASLHCSHSSHGSHWSRR